VFSVRTDVTAVYSPPRTNPANRMVAVNSLGVAESEE